MIAVAPYDRNRQAREYLKALRSMTRELDTAILAISMNVLSNLEESVDDQQVLSTNLEALAATLSLSGNTNAPTFQMGIDSELHSQILIAAEELQKVNRGYAALLQHSGCSVALMMSLMSSFSGQLQEASGRRSKYQTWSCQV